MKFAIFGNCFQAHKSAHAETLINLLNKYEVDIYICSEFFHFLTNDLNFTPKVSGLIVDDNFQADMVLSIGGDGTFLKAASRVGRKNIPILGINTGRLGFLADISPEEMDSTIKEILDNEYKIEERSIIKVEDSLGEITDSPFALNEVAILKQDSSSMISISTIINNSHLATYQADGLIIATPTGSTAYSLSVGGPIISPITETFVITPVAPHSLNIRPIVIKDDREIKLEVESRSHNFLVAIDGRSVSCSEGNILTVRKADYKIKVVKRCSHRFFETLRSKMMWGVDGRI